MSESKRFTSSDAWILLSTLYCGPNGGTRDQIVAAADYINHAIPTEAEWAGAVSRLRDSGILDERDGCMFVVDKFRRRLPTISKQTRTSVHKNLQRVEDFLEDLGKA